MDGRASSPVTRGPRPGRRRIALARGIACTLAALVATPPAFAAAPPATGSVVPHRADPTSNSFDAPIYLRSGRPLFRNFSPHFKVLERSPGDAGGPQPVDDGSDADDLAVPLDDLPATGDIHIWEAGNLLDDRTFGERVRPVNHGLADRIEGSFALHDVGEKLAIGGFGGFLVGSTCAILGYVYLKTVENGDPTNSVGKVVALDGAVIALAAEAVSLGGLALDFVGQPRGHVYKPREAARTVREYNTVSGTLPGNHPHLKVKF